jgi:predicted PhzF superfamily epimerase YddE/YHI9
MPPPGRRAAEVSIVSEQGTRMGRQSFVHIRLIYSNAETPAGIEVGGSVVPVLSGEIVMES